MALNSAMASAVFSGVTQVYGQYEEGRAYRDAGRINRQLADYEGEILDRQAQDALARGEESALRIHSHGRRIIGTQRARLAAQGIDINSGSAAEVQAGTAIIAEADALQVRNNAALEAMGYRSEAGFRRLEGRLAEMEGESRYRGARAGAFGSLITTGARLYDLYDQGRGNGGRRTR